MTPDRREDQHDALAAYRHRWRSAPHRAAYLDAVAAGELVLQQIWRPAAIDLDFAALCAGLNPSLVLIDDADGLGPAGWAAARDVRAWARSSIIVSPPAVPSEGADTALYAVLEAGAIARAVVIEAPAAAMPSWSEYLGAKGSPVWLIAGVEPVMAGMGARH